MRRETGSPKILVSGIGFFRASCLGADQKTHGLWERHCAAQYSAEQLYLARVKCELRL